MISSSATWNQAQWALILGATLAEQPPAFDEFHDAFEPLLAPHQLGRAKLAHQTTLVERANWKLVMENARECYHCAVNHPELSVTFPVGRRTLTQEEQVSINASFATTPAITPSSKIQTRWRSTKRCCTRRTPPGSAR